MKSRPAATKRSSATELEFRTVTDIWDALFEDDPPERERQRLLGDLALAIEKRIKQKGWTQKEAAKLMQVTQPRISNLLRGKLDLFSIDSLTGMAGAAGIHIDLSFRLDP